MSRSTREAVPAISLESGSGRSFQRQLMLRIEYVANQVAVTHAGQSEADVARVISERLRGMGLNPLPRQIQQHALAISRLPQCPPPPRAA